MTTDQPKTDAPGTDPGVNLTEQAMTAESRAAMHPTVPADPPAVEIIDRHLMAASDYYGPPATRRDDARTLYAALTDHDHIPAPRVDHLTTAEQLRRDLDKATRERDSLARRLAVRFEETEKARAERDEWEQNATRLGEQLDEMREARDILRVQVGDHRRTIAAQAEQLRRNGTLISRLKDLDEQADRIAAWRERAWAEHDTTDTPNLIEQEPDSEDLRSPLAAERDRLVETIGRLVSLPPEQIAEMHKVGYSGTPPVLGSGPTRAQDDRIAHALAAALNALAGAGRLCRYHGADFERLGTEYGEPRCDSCKQPYRVNRALDAIQAAKREG